MSSVNVSGFESSQYFSQIQEFLQNAPANTKGAQIKKAAGVYQFEIKNGSKNQIWTIDLKNEGTVTTSAPAKKADIIIKLDDKVFTELAQGKLNGQKAFMQGKLKATGNFALAGKLDSFFQEVRKSSTSSSPAASKEQNKSATNNQNKSAPSSGSTSDLEVPGFKASQVFRHIKAWVDSLTPEERKKEVAKVKGLFQLDINNGSKIQTWTIDLKNQPGDAYVGPPKSKPDAIIKVSDGDFMLMSNGKLNGQNAFMKGKLKVKGQIMLATKLDGLFRSLPKAKL